MIYIGAIVAIVIVLIYLGRRSTPTTGERFGEVSDSAIANHDQTAYGNQSSSSGVHSEWPSLGILFDIDRLGDTEMERMFYGNQARQIFMEHLDPGFVGPAWLWQGDTQATLDGRERCFCIAATAKDPQMLMVLRQGFSDIEAKGLAPRASRFLEQPVPVEMSMGIPKPIHREPLDLWFSVDEQGTFGLPSPLLMDDVLVCHKYGRKFRVPNAEEAAGAVLKVLRVRGLVVSDVAREHILAQKDPGRLERWLAKYAFVDSSSKDAVAASIAELVDDST
jgi:hypothetical protein